MRTLSGYSDLKVLYEGHRNIVYSATRVIDNKPVIIKALRSSNPPTEEIAFLYHEFEVTKGLDLPGVIKTYDLIEEQSTYALAQEDIHGISVREYIKKHPIKELAVFYKIALQMVTILGEIHRNHIIHKDIKPGNFIIEPHALHEKLTDFNYAAKLLHEVQDVVPPEKLEGTLAYMAPEQTGRMNMNIDYRSDFYALGVTFYELLTGQLPFSSDDPLELVHAHLATPAPDASKLNSAIPASLVMLVQKLMAKNPTERYQSVIGIQADLERIASGETEPFTLGQQEVFDRLNISQKLYGREEEAKTLLKAYNRVSQGGVEALFVCGYSGIGKTMLVNEVHRPMVEHKGYFISGKFDQLQRNTPYTAITQCFNQLANHIMSEPEERFNAIKEDLQKTLGTVAQVMIDLAPHLERVLGKQPPLAILPSRETQNRMMTFFKRFLKVVARSEHPLVIFIDDLQWADSGSLKLLEYIMTDDELSHILLIGAYRDNEVDNHHPLRLLLKYLESEQRAITFLPLGPLTVEHYNALLLDSFGLDTEVLPLAELIHKRTEGNPFFCKQVIGTIYQQKLLYFDYEKRKWDWKLEDIRQLNITDNVIDLMLSKLLELPEETQTLLKFASCVGHRFTIDTLHIISGQFPEAIGKSLWPALQKELILTLNLEYKRVDAMSHESLALILSKEITYRFIHDRVQQAVYQSIPDDVKEHTHLNIARLLIQNDPEGCKQERLFEVCDHYNRAKRLLNEDEKAEVANLNYKAGMVALSANAYEPMLNYFQAGLAVTDESWWEEKYELMFKLNRGYAQSLYLAGKIEEAASLAQKLLDKGKNALDKVSIYRIQCVHFVSDGKSSVALDIGIEALRLLGVKIQREPSMLKVLYKAYEVKWALRKYNISTLDKELQELKDPSIISAFELLSELIYLVYWAPGNSYIYLGLITMLMMLQYGSPPSAGLWVTIYAMSTLHLFKDVDDVFTLWDLAQRFIDRTNNKYSSSTAYTFRAYWMNHLRYPFKEANTYFQLGMQDAYESGNLISVAVNMSTRNSNGLCEAKSCDELLENGQKTLDYCKKISLKDYILQLDERLVVFQTFLEGESTDSAILPLYDKIMQGKNEFHQAVVTALMATYAFYFERYDEAYEYHKKWYAKEKKVRYSTTFFVYLATDGLIIAKLLQNASFFKKFQYLRRFKKLYKQLKWAAKTCPHNYLHHFLALEAAQEKMRGNFNKALDCLNEAIENAHKGDFYLQIGLYNEMAAELLYEQGLPKCALKYIHDSHYYYSRFGMKVRVKGLEKRYPECFMGQANLTEKTAESTSAISTTSASLDFMSVIKASQTISGEIKSEKLLEKMLHIAIENAGAEKALFFEQQKGSWILTASMCKTNFQMHTTPLKEYHDVSQIVIALTIRSEAPVVISDARTDEHLREDVYVQTMHPKSILCMPIMHHDTVIGVLYLENFLAVGSFTQTRVTVLKTLASQIAISLENAHYLEHTEALYKATERFVPKPFLRLLKKEHIEDVQLGDCIETTISALFTDIRDYTTITEGLNPQQAFQFINDYLRVMGPIIRAHHGFINQYQGDAIMALFPRRADDALKAVREMVDALATYNEEQAKQNHPQLRVGYGVNTGLAMLGTIGEHERMDANVISDAINLASRVESLNKFYGTEFLISDATLDALIHPEEYAWRLVDKVQVKGKRRAIYLYQVYCSGVQDELIKEYEAAFKAYEQGDLEKALTGFLKCQNIQPQDKATTVLLERCQTLKKTGLPKEWNGTYSMDHK